MHALKSSNVPIRREEQRLLTIPTTRKRMLALMLVVNQLLT
jgi:hypothetical protein